MDALLKACVVLLLLLTGLIAVAPFTHVATIPAPQTPKPGPAIKSVLPTTCPLRAVEALIDSKQLMPMKTGRSPPQCMEVGVADSLWQTLDVKDRQGLVLAVACAVSTDQPIPCLKLYSQISGALFASSEMGKVSIGQ
jgi:hypothetical protein